MNDNLFLRPADLQQLKEALAEGACCSIVGLSNIGKSMRCAPPPRARLR
jgi:hypothetical protein